MLGADRRGPTARRGMTVLGKIPAVPKPINLPSQRLENRGLDPNVELVPRGSVTWGAGKSPPVSGSSNVWGSTSQSTVSSGPWGSGTAKPPQAAANSLWGPAPGGSAPTPPGAGSGPSIPVSRPSSAGSAVQASGTASAWGGQARPSSASTMPMQMQDAQPARPHSAEARAGGFYGPQSGSSGAQGAPVWEAQRPAEEPHHASKFQLTRGDFPSLGSEKDPDLRPQGQPAERPRSADERRSTSNTGFQDEGSSDMDYRGPRGMQDSWKRGNGAAPSDGPGGTYDTWRQGGPPSPDSWRREAGPPADSWRRDMRPSSAEARSEEWQGDGYGRDGPPPDSSRRREGGHGPGGAPPDTWRREGTSPSSGGIPPEHWRRDMPGGPGMLGPPFGPHPRFGGPAPGPYGGPGPGYGGFMRPDGYGPGMFRPGPMSDRRMRGPAFPGPPFDGYYGPPGRGPIRPGFGGADEREMGMMGPEGGVLGHRFPGPGGPARGYMGFGPDRFGRFGPAGPGGHIPGPYPGPGQRERPERDERGERERLEPPRASEPGVGREGGGRREGGRGEAHSEGLDGSSNDVSRQSRGSHHHGHHALGLDWASASEEAMDYSKPVFDDEPLSRSGGRQRSEDAPSASNLQDELPQTKGFTVPSVTETSESEKQNVADGSERQAENSQETDDSKNGASVKESVSSPQTTGKSMDTIRILKRAGDAGSQDSSPVGSPGPKEQQPVTSRGLQPAQAQGLAGMPESVPVPAPAASAPSTPAGDASGPAPPAPPMAPHVIQFGQIAHQDGLLNDIIRASAGVKIATVDSQGASTTQEAQSQQVSGVVSVPGSLVAATRISNKSASTLSKAPGAAGAGAASQSLPSMHGGTSRVSQGAPSGPLLENARTSISEEEGVVVAGSAAAVDYEAQRARMREIAEQRAQALKVQEEGRQKEQKAKAQAKLEELNRRVRGGAPTVSEGNVNAGVGVLQQAAASDIPPLLNADSGEGVKVAVAAPADGPGGGNGGGRGGRGDARRGLSDRGGDRRGGAGRAQSVDLKVRGPVQMQEQKASGPGSEHVEPSGGITTHGPIREPLLPAPSGPPLVRPGFQQAPGNHFVGHGNAGPLRYPQQHVHDRAHRGPDGDITGTRQHGAGQQVQAPQHQHVPQQVSQVLPFSSHDQGNIQRQGPRQGGPFQPGLREGQRGGHSRPQPPMHQQQPQQPMLPAATHAPSQSQGPVQQGGQIPRQPHPGMRPPVRHGGGPAGPLPTLNARAGTLHPQQPPHTVVGFNVSGPGSAAAAEIGMHSSWATATLNGPLPPPPPMPVLVPVSTVVPVFPAGPVPAAGTVTRQQQQVATGAEQGSENRASSDSSEGGGPLRSDKEGGRKKSRSGRAGGGQSKKAARGPEGQQPESAAADAGGGQGRALAPKGVGTSATLPAGGAGGAPTSQGGGGGDGGVAGGDSGALGKEAGSQHAPPPPPRQRGSGERGRAPSSNAGSTGGGPAGSGARGQGPSREAGNDPAPVNSQTLQGPAEGDKGRGEPAKPSVAKKPLPPQRQRPPPRLPQDGRPADRGQQQHQQGPDGSSSRGAVAKASTNDAKAAAGETGVAAPLAAGAAKGQGQGQGQGPGDGQRQPRRVDAQHSTRQQVLPPPQQQQQQHAGPGGKKKADNQVGSTRPVPHLAQPQQQQQQQQQVPGGVAVAANEMAAGAHAQGGRSRRAEMERYSPKLALQQQQRQQQHPPGDGPAPPALPQGGLQNVTHGPHGTAGAPLPARSQPGGGRSFVQLGQQAGQAGGQQQLAAQQSSRQPSQQHAGPNHNHGTNQLPGDQQQQQGPGSAHWGAVPQGRPLHPAPGAKSIPPGAGGLAAATGHQPGVAPSRGAAAATSAAPDSQGGGGSTAERAQAPAVDVGAEGGARPGSAAHGGGGAGRRTSRGGAGASRGGRGGAPAHEQGGAAVGHQAGRGGGSAQAGSETGGQMAQEPRSATGRAVGGNLNALDGSGSRGGELVSREQHHHHQQQQVPGNPRPSAPGSQAQAQGQGGRHRPAAQGPHGNVAPAHQRPQGGPPAPGGGPTQAQRSNGPLSHVQSSNLNVRNASGGPAPSGPPPPARSLQTGVLGTPPVKDEKAVGQSAGTSGPRPSGAQGGVGAGRGTPDSRGKYQVINATGGAVPNPQAAS